MIQSPEHSQDDIHSVRSLLAKVAEIAGRNAASIYKLTEQVNRVVTAQADNTKSIEQLTELPDPASKETAIEPSLNPPVETVSDLTSLHALVSEIARLSKDNADSIHQLTEQVNRVVTTQADNTKAIEQLTQKVMQISNIAARLP